MGGSKNTPGNGMGIPGIFLSLLKEISSIPPLNQTQLPKLVSDWYSKDKFDMRKELAVVKGLKKQSIPIIINECIVRTFFFVRRLILEKQLHEDWKDVNWHNVLPFNNRTISRMLTISSGTFMAIDMADAAIRAAIKGGGHAIDPIEFALRVNFVGVGRFAIAVWSDTKMGLEKNRTERERSILIQEMMELYNARMYYKTADMWREAANAEEAIHRTESAAKLAIATFSESWNSISDDLETISKKKSDIERNNPDLLNKIKDSLN